ncbi:MAG TPA: multiheme c-type cytochrome, partial [Anaerolineae bacterium]
MRYLPRNLGKMMVIAACAVVALALVAVVITAVPTTAAPMTQTATTPPVPAAQVSIIPVPANAALPNAITVTIKSITDTAVGPKNTTIAVMTSGLNNVPISVPVKLIATPADPKFQGKVVWRLSVPNGSKAKLTATDKAQTSFTPDVVGFYMATANFQSADGKTNGATDTVRLHAGMFEGVTAGKCVTCHPGKAAEWAKTGHAKIFSDELDNKRTPDVPTHYAERCAGCHNTGFYPAPYGGAGGYYDAVTKTKWQFPTFKQIDAAGKGGASNWAAAPDAVKNIANIQCETCHGPAKEHVEKGAKVMDSSQAEGVCNQCHNGGGHHLKGTDLQNAAHADQKAAAWNIPVGPGEQQCVRCHSGNGYVSFLADPKNPAAWDNTMQTVVCSTCHDPHSEANMFQLRIVDKPIELPFQVTKNVGLSATCYECHNA